MNYDNAQDTADNQDAPVELTAEDIKEQKKAAAKAAYDVKAAEKKAAKEIKDAASAVAKQEVKDRKAAEKLAAAEGPAKRVPKTAEEKRLAINAATALRRSTPEGKAYAAAAAAKSYAKKTAAARALKQEAADLAALEALAANDEVAEVSPTE